MTKRGSIRTLALALLFIVGLAPATYAQPELLKQAVDLHDRGKDDEALAKLKELLASDPSSDAAFEMLESIEMKQWARMMTRSGEHAAVIKALFNLAMPAAKAKASDAATIRGLLSKADGSYAERRDALAKLVADHGEYAVPHLLDRMGADDTERRAKAILICRRLGTQATLPLIQALEIENPRLQASALTALGMIGDKRALPYVSAYALGPGEDGMLRDAATAALANMGASHITSDQIGGLFLGLAEAFYRRDTEVVDPFRSTYVAWSQADGKLVAAEVPRDIYHLKLAEEVLYDMINWDANQRDAQVLLGSCLIAQSVAAAGGGEEAASSALGHADEMAASMGAEIMDAVVRKALADGRPAIAAAAVKTLGSVLDADTFMAPNALTEALSAPYKAVRFNAALAIFHLGVRGDFAERDQVVSVLMEALGQDAIRTCVVIDDNADTRNRIVSDLNARGYFAYGVSGGAMGLAQLRDYPIEDLCIIRYNLQDATVAEVIKTIRNDARTAEMPVAILCDPADKDAAEAAYADKAQAFISTPPTVEAYEPSLRALVKDVDAAREGATKIAASAAMAFAHMDPRGNGYSSAGAVNALVATLKGDDRVRTPALIALGRIGDASANAAIMAVFGDTTASEDVRGQAAIALARIARASGSVGADVVAAIQAAIAGDGSGEYLGALGRACGILPIDLKTRTQLLNTLRAKITVDNDG